MNYLIKRCAELHLEHRALLRRVLLRPTSVFRQEQREPRLERPRQRRHHHVRPVAHPRAHRHPQRVHTVLQLLDEVLLVASIVGEEESTIEEVVEPYLLKVGYIERTPRGRQITPAGERYLRG